MTATPLPSRVRARFRARARVALAIVAALLMFGPATLATASTDDDARGGDLVLSLAAGQGGVLPDTAGTSFTVTAHNTTEAAIPAGLVSLWVGETPLGDTAALTAWLSGGDAPGVMRSVTTQTVPALAGGDTAQWELLASAEDLGFASEDAEKPVTAPAPGVYPVRAQYAGAQAQAVLIVAAERPVAAAIIVPVTLTPAGGVLLTAGELATATGEGGVLTGILDAVAGTAAILAVDPAIPAAIRVLGDAAPASAQTWLTALDALPNERFALQFADTDLAAPAQAGLAEPLAPTGLSSIVDASVDAATSLDDLTHIRGARTDIVWPRPALGPADLAAFDDYVGSPATTVLPAAFVTGTGPAVTVEGHRVLVPNAAASEWLSLASISTDEAEREKAMGTGVAHLALAGENVLVALDRDDARDPAALTEVLTALARLTTPLTLAELDALPAPTATLRAATDTERAEAIAPLLHTENELTAFATILADPALLTEPERIRLLRLYSVPGPGDDFTAALETFHARTAALLSSVDIQPSSTVQILSASVDLPVWVRNDLPWPITVILQASPDSTRLDVQAHSTVESLPNNNTRVRVPVTARVASGEVDITLRLTSPTGVRVGSEQVIPVVVRAEWESIGLVILGVAVALLLTFGVIRTVRKKRHPQIEEAAHE